MLSFVFGNEITDSQYELVFKYLNHSLHLTDSNLFNIIGKGSHGFVLELQKSLQNNELSQFESNLAFKYSVTPNTVN